MKYRDNPNYFFTDKPYKRHYICCDCRKSFKRRVLSDINPSISESKDAKCPDCGKLAIYVGPKFRAPKSHDIRAWKSIEIISGMRIIGQVGWATSEWPIPKSKRSLDILLERVSLFREFGIKRRKLSSIYKSHK